LDRAKSREVHLARVRRLVAVAVKSSGPAMLPDRKKQKGRTMLKKLLGAAAMAATAFAFVPAQAAHHHVAHVVGVGCSGDNFAKAEGEVEVMADSPNKFMAEREIAEAQDAMLSGKVAGCSMHLSQALRDESSPSPYQGMMTPGPFVNTGAQAQTEPAPEASSQRPSNWTPMKGAY
jgi:hypothetical protein